MLRIFNICFIFGCLEICHKYLLGVIEIIKLMLDELTEYVLS